MSSTVLGLDPGPRESAYCRLTDGKPVVFGKVSNDQLLAELRHGTTLLPNAEVVIETIFPRGQSVGLETMDTQFVAGQIAEAAYHQGRHWHKIDRQDVRYAICGSLNTNDANVRQALIDRFGGQDALKCGGKCKQCSDGRIWNSQACDRCHGTGQVVGTRKPVKCPACKGRKQIRMRVSCPVCLGTRQGEPAGILAGVKNDVWSALAICVSFELRKHFVKRDSA